MIYDDIWLRVQQINSKMMMFHIVFCMFARLWIYINLLIGHFWVAIQFIIYNQTMRPLGGPSRFPYPNATKGQFHHVDSWCLVQSPDESRFHVGPSRQKKKNGVKNHETAVGKEWEHHVICFWSFIMAMSRINASFLTWCQFQVLFSWAQHAQIDFQVQNFCVLPSTYVICSIGHILDDYSNPKITDP